MGVPFVARAPVASGPSNRRAPTESTQDPNQALNVLNMILNWNNPQGSTRAPSGPGGIPDFTGGENIIPNNQIPGLQNPPFGTPPGAVDKGGLLRTLGKTMADTTGGKLFGLPMPVALELIRGGFNFLAGATAPEPQERESFAGEGGERGRLIDPRNALYTAQRGALHAGLGLARQAQGGVKLRTPMPGKTPQIDVPGVPFSLGGVGMDIPPAELPGLDTSAPGGGDLVSFFEQMLASPPPANVTGGPRDPREELINRVSRPRIAGFGPWGTPVMNFGDEDGGDSGGTGGGGSALARIGGAAATGVSVWDFLKRLLGSGGGDEEVGPEGDLISELVGSRRGAPPIRRT